ncbi:hypothetical protein ABBQ38_010028 [Trebouxia sp. C0009 RCD-2024]
MDVLGPYPSGHADGFDVLISDVKPEDLPGRISQALGVQYLAEMQSRPTPVSGIVFNTKNSTLRVLVTLPVSVRGRSVAVHFIFDTTAPCTYIALSVLQALNLPEVSLYSEVVRINGVKSVLSVSDTTKATYGEGHNKVEVPCHFVGLNILGMDFLDRAGIKLEMDLANNAVVLSSTQFPVIG